MLAWFLQERRRKRGGSFSPTLVSGLKLWVRAESLSGLSNNAAVASWQDESGAGHHLAQATASFRPKFLTNAGGLAGVSFDGVDDVMATAGNVFVTDSHVIFVVGQPANAGNQDWVGTGGTSAGDVLMQVGAGQNIRGHAWRGASLTAADGWSEVLTTGFSLMEQQVTPTQMLLRRNGGDEFIGAMAGVGGGVAKPITLGSRSSGYNFGGVIRALLVFEGVPSDADLARVRTFLKRAYALPDPVPFVVPAPVIEDGYFQWGDTEPGWVDNYLFFSFSPGPLPVASFEIWERDSNNASHLIATIGSNAGDYQHARVSEDADTFYYQIRYKNGGTVGPFSNEFPITVDI